MCYLGIPGMLSQLFIKENKKFVNLILTDGLGDHRYLAAMPHGNYYFAFISDFPCYQFMKAALNVLVDAINDRETIKEGIIGGTENLIWIHFE